MEEKREVDDRFSLMKILLLLVAGDLPLLSFHQME
jgi:hypothetical protein